MGIHPVTPTPAPCFVGKLVVTTDAGTPGSEGRLYLQLPSFFDAYVDHYYRSVGCFATDGGVLLVREKGIDGPRITPRRQYWWKNGVRDHRLRVNWDVFVFVPHPDLWAVMLVLPTGEEPPKLPSRQLTVFE